MGNANVVTMSVTVTIQLPDDAFSVLRTTPEEFAQELKRAAICKRYELGMLSQSMGAEFAGVSREEFLSLLSRYRVTPFQTTKADLREEMERE